MTDIIVDFSSIEADEFSVVKEGEYDATIKKAFIKKKAEEEPGKKKYPYISLECAIDEGQDFAGASLFINNLSLSTEGNNPPIKRTKFFLLSVGADIDKSDVRLQVGPNGELLEPNIIGQPVHCWVGRRTYQGRPQADVYRIHGKHEVQNGRAVAAAESRYK